MPTYGETWDEAVPAGSRERSLGDDDIRAFKRAIRERLATDHIFLASESGGLIGYHKKIVFAEVQASNPSSAANQGYLFIKDVAAKAELFWGDEDGNTLQLTTAGAFNYTGVVFTTTNQTVAGVKTFTSQPSLFGFLLTDNADFNQKQAIDFVLENRNSDPAAPVAGQIWFRTDI